RRENWTIHAQRSNFSLYVLTRLRLDRLLSISNDVSPISARFLASPIRMHLAYLPISSQSKSATKPSTTAKYVGATSRKWESPRSYLLRKDSTSFGPPAL